MSLAQDRVDVACPALDAAGAELRDRDVEDYTENYPGAGWPEQARRALRGLIRAWDSAREQGLPAIPAEDSEPLELEFRRAVTVGLAAVSRVPGPRKYGEAEALPRTARILPRPS